MLFYKSRVVLAGFVIFNLLTCSFVYSQESQENEVERDRIVGGSFNIDFLDGRRSIFIPQLGQFGLFTSTSEDVKSFFFRVSPHIGKKLNNGSWIGARINYAYVNNDRIAQRLDSASGQTLSIPLEDIGHEIGLGIFYRLPLVKTGKLKFFIEPSIGYTYAMENEFDDGEIRIDTKVNFLSINGWLLAMYDINEKWFILSRYGNIAFLNGNFSRTIFGETEETETNVRFNQLTTRFGISTFSLGAEYRF